MSGLEALGLACNIFQVISFASETIAFCKAVYQGQSPDSRLGPNADSLATLSAGIEQHYYQHRPQAVAERKIHDLATKCNIAARALSEEADFLVGHKAKGSLTATLRIAVKTNWRRKRLDKLEKSLGDYQKTLESHLLARICNQSDAIELSAREGFEKLEGRLQYFVSQYASGHTALSDLVKEEVICIKEHTVKEILRSEQAVRSHVTRVTLSATQSITTEVDKRLTETTRVISHDIHRLEMETATKTRRNRFLNSLVFPASNERRNHVSESHHGTLQWIFGSYVTGDNGSSDESASSVGDDKEVSNDSASSDEKDGTSSSEDASDTDSSHLWDNFGDWLKSESNFYWINGKPGSGKSTLVKFLINSPHTKRGLDLRAPNTLILQHFFWKPGSQMQKNIRGLLCGLLHQTVSNNEAALDDFLSGSSSLQSKDSHTDWSAEELLRVLGRFLASAPRPLCIFIDGLDETWEEDGCIVLMKVLDELRNLPNTKLCVASRPEPRFCKCFCNAEQLRLQDFTRNDMLQYVGDMMRPFLPPPHREPIIYKLLGKADGVFLWVHLAVKSPLRGLENGDNSKVLFQRLECLPNELSRLYHDMWTRLNDDIPLYREAAARYFNLVIDAAYVKDELEKNDLLSFYSPFFACRDNISVLQVMAATESRVPEILVDQGGELEESRLLQLCDRTVNAINSRCAGIMEVVVSQPPVFSTSITGQHETVVHYLGQHVRFIHRTAFDFLVNSEDGLGLLAHDSSSREERLISILRATLAVYGIMNKYHHVHKILVPLSWVQHPDFRDLVEATLDTCWAWYDSGRLDYPAQLKPHFLAVAAGIPFPDYVLSRIAKSANPSRLATDVLRSVMWPLALRYDRTSNFCDVVLSLLKPLLALGADPFAKGPYLSVDSLPSMTRAVGTAFGKLLRAALQLHPKALRHIPDLLSTFLAESPENDEVIPLFLSAHDTILKIRDVPVQRDLYLGEISVTVVGGGVYFSRALHLRAAQRTFAGASTKRLESQLNEISSRQILPAKSSLQVVHVTYCPGQGDISRFVRFSRCVRYRVFHDQGDPQLERLLGLIELCLCGVEIDSDLVKDEISVLVHSNIFEEVGSSAEAFLAQRSCGFEFVGY